MSANTFLLNATTFLQRHAWALVCSVAVGLIAVGPQIYFRTSLGNQFQGLDILRADAETHYVSRMASVYHGSVWGNPFIKEYTNETPSMPMLSEYFLALPGKWIGIPVAVLNLVYKFLFPFILFWLIYFLFFRITSSRIWSLACGTAVILGYEWLSIPDILQILHGVPYTQFIQYARPSNPALSSTIFFGYLHVLLSAVRTKKKILIIPLAALFLGAITVYLYAWTFLLALVFVLAGIAFVKKDRELLKILVLSTAIGLVLGIPIFYAYAQIFRDPNYLAYAVRQGLRHGRYAVIGWNACFATVVFLGYLWYARGRSISVAQEQKMFFGGLLLASWISVNQQLVTGVSLEYGHYYWYYNTPIFICILLWVCYSVREKFPTVIRTGIPVIVLVASGIFGIYNQVTSYRSWASYTADQQSLMPVFRWLDAHASSTDVVLANEEVSSLIPIFTHSYVAWAFHARYYLLPPKRIDDAYQAYSLLLAQEPLERKNEDLVALFGSTGSGAGAFSQVTSSTNVLPYLQKIHVTYLVWDMQTDPDWRVGDIPGSVVVYDSTRWKILKIPTL